MKLVYNAKSYKVVLPKAIVEIVMKWKEGDELKVDVDGDKITLRRV
jgi:bifunctional DNA-binding transcriptional regulator/antitoxin component of YhaV-PrlF toxin-antitoxin module